MRRDRPIEPQEAVPAPPPAAAPAVHTDPAPPLTANLWSANPDDTQQLSAEITHLRHALAQVLARETGQDIAVFESLVVNNTRLCGIADNIYHHRHWAA